jgi:hypothetical protein
VAQPPRPAVTTRSCHRSAPSPHPLPTAPSRALAWAYWRTRSWSRRQPSTRYRGRADRGRERVSPSRRLRSLTDDTPAAGLMKEYGGRCHLGGGLRSPRWASGSEARGTERSVSRRLRSSGGGIHLGESVRPEWPFLTNASKTPPAVRSHRWAYGHTHSLCPNTGLWGVVRGRWREAWRRACRGVNRGGRGAEMRSLIRTNGGLMFPSRAAGAQLPDSAFGLHRA